MELTFCPFAACSHCPVNGSKFVALYGTRNQVNSPTIQWPTRLYQESQIEMLNWHSILPWCLYLSITVYMLLQFLSNHCEG